MSKKPETTKPQPPRKKGETTPLLIYIAVGLGALIGYIVGEGVWIRQPHLVHYILIIPLGIVGYFVGRWIYRLRDYQDII